MNDAQRRAMFAKQGQPARRSTTPASKLRAQPATVHDLPYGQYEWYKGRGGFEGPAQIIDRDDIRGVERWLDDRDLTATWDDMGMDAIVYNVRPKPAEPLEDEWGNSI